MPSPDTTGGPPRRLDELWVELTDLERSAVCEDLSEHESTGVDERFYKLVRRHHQRGTDIGVPRRQAPNLSTAQPNVTATGGTAPRRSIDALWAELTEHGRRAVCEDLAEHSGAGVEARLEKLIQRHHQRWADLRLVRGGLQETHPKPVLSCLGNVSSDGTNESNFMKLENGAADDESNDNCLTGKGVSALPQSQGRKDIKTNSSLGDDSKRCAFGSPRDLAFHKGSAAGPFSSNGHPFSSAVLYSSSSTAAVCPSQNSPFTQPKPSYKQVIANPFATKANDIGNQAQPASAAKSDDRAAEQVKRKADNAQGPGTTKKKARTTKSTEAEKGNGSFPVFKEGNKNSDPTMPPPSSNRTNPSNDARSAVLSPIGPEITTASIAVPSAVCTGESTKIDAPRTRAGLVSSGPKIPGLADDKGAHSSSMSPELNVGCGKSLVTGKDLTSSSSFARPSSASESATLQPSGQNANPFPLFTKTPSTGSSNPFRPADELFRWGNVDQSIAAGFDRVKKNVSSANGSPASKVTSTKKDADVVLNQYSEVQKPLKQAETVTGDSTGVPIPSENTSSSEPTVPALDIKSGTHSATTARLSAFTGSSRSNRKVPKMTGSGTATPSSKPASIFFAQAVGSGGVGTDISSPLTSAFSRTSGNETPKVSVTTSKNPATSSTKSPVPKDLKAPGHEDLGLPDSKQEYFQPYRGSAKDFCSLFSDEKFKNLSPEGLKLADYGRGKQIGNFPRSAPPRPPQVQWNNTNVKQESELNNTPFPPSESAQATNTEQVTEPAQAISSGTASQSVKARRTISPVLSARSPGPSPSPPTGKVVPATAPLPQVYEDCLKCGKSVLVPPNGLKPQHCCRYHPRSGTFDDLLVLNI